LNFSEILAKYSKFRQKLLGQNLTKMKISEISQVIFWGQENSWGSRQNIAESFPRTLGTILENFSEFKISPKLQQYLCRPHVSRGDMIIWAMSEINWKQADIEVKLIQVKKKGQTLIFLPTMIMEISLKNILFILWSDYYYYCSSPHATFFEPPSLIVSQHCVLQSYYNHALRLQTGFCL